MENSNNFFRSYIKLRVEHIRGNHAYHERAMIHEADISVLNYHRKCIDQFDAILTELEYMLNMKD